MPKSDPEQSRLLAAPVVPLILRVALPGMAGMLATSFSALFDALIMSRVHEQLAAVVSLGYPIWTCIQTIGFTLGIGAGSFVSRSIGSGDEPAACRASSSALIGALVLSLALCAAGFVFAQPLVRLLGAHETMTPAAAVYARYVLASGPMLCSALVISSLLRGQGKTTPNMLAFFLGAGVSVALEWLLVKRLSLGVHGAGVSMLAREAVTLAALLLSMRKGKLIRPSLRGCSLRLSVFREIMRSGLPTLIRQGLMSLSALLFTRTGAAFGEAALAGTGLAVRLCALVSSAVIGFGQGFQPVCGAAFGAGNMERVRAAYAFCLRWVMIACAVVGAAFFFFARPLVLLFGLDAQASAYALSSLRAQSAVFFAMGAVIMMNMLTQAMGMTVRASVIAASRQGFVLIALIKILPRLFGAAGLVICQGVSDLISLLLCYVLTRRVIRDSSCARGGCWGARKAFRSDRRS